MNTSNAISALLGQTNPAATPKGDGAKGAAKGVLNMGVTPQNGDGQASVNIGAVFQAVLNSETAQAQAQATSHTNVQSAGSSIINTGQLSVQAKILEAQSATGQALQQNGELSSETNESGAQAMAGAALVLPANASEQAKNSTADVIITGGNVLSANNTPASTDGGETASIPAPQNANTGRDTTGATNAASAPQADAQTLRNSKAQAITSPITPHKTVGTDNDVMVGSLGDSISVDPSGNLGGKEEAKSVPSAVTLAPETSFSNSADTKSAAQAQPAATSDAALKGPADKTALAQAQAHPKGGTHEAPMLASESPRALLNAAEARNGEAAEGKAANNTSTNASQGTQNASAGNGQNGGQAGAQNNGQNTNTGQDAQRLQAQMSKADGKMDANAASKPVESFEELLKSPASQSISSGLSNEVRHAHMQNVAMTAHSPLTRATAAVQNLGLQIGKSVSEGDTKFTIRMDPPSLGRIDVKMEMMADGKMKAYLSVEHRETLNLLQRDSAALERTLQDAGLKMDQSSLNFSLKQQGEQAGNEFKNAHNSSSHESDSGFDVNMSNDDVSEIIMQQVITDSAVDIRI